MTRFIGRKYEFHRLELLLQNSSASLVVINGRRRIGKSRLIKEFGKDKELISFAGLTPRPHITAQDQRNEFIRQFREHFDFPTFVSKDWGYQQCC